MTTGTPIKVSNLAHSCDCCFVMRTVRRLNLFCSSAVPMCAFIPLDGEEHVGPREENARSHLFSSLRRALPPPLLSPSYASPADRMHHNEWSKQKTLIIYSFNVFGIFGHLSSLHSWCCAVEHIAWLDTLIHNPQGAIKYPLEMTAVMLSWWGTRYEYIIKSYL